MKISRTQFPKTPKQFDDPKTWKTSGDQQHGFEDIEELKRKKTQEN